MFEQNLHQGNIALVNREDQRGLPGRGDRIDPGARFEEGGHAFGIAEPGRNLQWGYTLLVGLVGIGAFLREETNPSRILTRRDDVQRRFAGPDVPAVDQDACGGAFHHRRHRSRVAFANGFEELVSVGPDPARLGERNAAQCEERKDGHAGPIADKRRRHLKHSCHCP